MAVRDNASTTRDTTPTGPAGTRTGRAAPAKRLLLLGLMWLAAVNIPTGAPLAAIWVGSRVQGGAVGLSMTAVLAVLVALALMCAALVWALDRMAAMHDALIDRPPARRQTAWMKPFNDRTSPDDDAPLRALDRILVATVVGAGIAFEAWFFFLAGSPIG
jgi:hypothetical protein